MKILIVDDSKAMLFFRARTLEQARLGHHRFLQAADGHEVFTLVNREAPEVVLADGTMSVVGFNLLRGLRGVGNTALFGFITVRAGPARRAEALQAGAQFLVGKPCTAASPAEFVGKCIHD